MTAQRPNFLFFMTDQQRGATVAPDHPCQTPTLDRFAAEGLRFTDARCPSPHCCPSRATFFSGLYPSEHGVWHNVNVANAISRDLRPEVRLWSEELAAAGYRCALSGKWHLSDARGPECFGWEVHSHRRPDVRPPESRPAPERAELEAAKDRAVAGNWQHYRHHVAGEQPGARGPGEIHRSGYGSYRHYGIDEDPFADGAVTRSGIADLADLAAGEDPWCLYIGTLGPHDPYRVPQRFLDQYRDVDVPLPPSFDDPMTDKPGLYRRTRDRFAQLSPDEHREAIRHYWALCSYEDHLFGEVLAALAASGQAENTVVVFLSDHGDYVADHGLWCKGLPCFRGAYEIPFVVRYPAGLANPGRSCAAKIGLEDVARTVLELAGCDHASWPGSGRSLVPFLHDRAPADWRRAHCTQSDGNELYGIQRSIDTGRWKYVFNGFDYDELYDLADDPHECRNRIEDPGCAEVVAELSRELWAFARDHRDHCINPYIMVALAPHGPGSAFDRDGRPHPSPG